VPAPGAAVSLQCRTPHHGSGDERSRRRSGIKRFAGHIILNLMSKRFSQALLRLRHDFSV
jgi:hypothetical protein